MQIGGADAGCGRLGHGPGEVGLHLPEALLAQKLQVTGKTTTLKATLGIIGADEGTVRLFGQAVTPGSAALDELKSRIAKAPGYRRQRRSPCPAPCR